MTEHGELLYKAVIPFEPKSKKNNLCIKFKKQAGANALYKNSKYGMVLMGIPFVSQSDTYKQYERDCVYWLRRPQNGTINEKINIRYLFYRSNRIRVDIGNLVAAADDILVKFNIIQDDYWGIVGGHDGSRVFIDKDNPRTEIYIERWCDDGKEN